MKNTYIKSLIPIILWSTAFLGVKTGLQYASPFFFAGTRFMLSGVLLLFFIRDIRGVISHTKTHWMLVLKTAILQTTLFYGLYYAGIDRVPASIAAIIIGAIPLFSAVASHLFLKNDSLNMRKIISLFVAIGGIVLISLSRDPMTKTGLREIFGISLLLTACLSEAVLQVVLKRNSKPYDPLKLNAVQIFIGGFILFLISLPVEGVPSFRQPGTFYLSLVWLSIVSAVAFSIWYELLQKPEVKISELNMMKFLNPVIGAGLSWIFMRNDSPDIYSITGMLIISCSVIFFYLRIKPVKAAVQDDRS
ncbi:MAG: DMT family transporter [Bacteroidetes bacterium]|nr:DMT family transporter [Bacteroidota bacterium]